jgi:hypothetical protein
MKLELEKIIDHHYSMITAHKTAIKGSRNKEHRDANNSRIQYHQKVVDALTAAWLLMEEP